MVSFSYSLVRCCVAVYDAELSASDSFSGILVSKTPDKVSIYSFSSSRKLVAADGRCLPWQTQTPMLPGRYCLPRNDLYSDILYVLIDC